MLTPYDLQETIKAQDEAVRSDLKKGSPVVAVSCKEGIFLLTVRKRQRKVFEIYDRLIFSAIGKQSDIEAIRLAAIDFCHQEGYQRSPDDVTIQRVVGYSLSPLLKGAYGDPMALSVSARSVFAQLGVKPEDDLVFQLDFTGDFSPQPSRAGISGDDRANDAMNAYLAEHIKNDTPLKSAVKTAVTAWAIGKETINRNANEPVTTEQAEKCLQDELKDGDIEVGILNRLIDRDNRFQLLTPSEIEEMI